MSAGRFLMVWQLAALLLWGLPAPTTQQHADTYLGVIERIAHDESDPDPKGEDVWARVAFRRLEQREWSPAVGEAKDLEELDAAPSALPKTINWRVCRDGQSVGTVASKRRRFQLYADRGIHALRARPPFVDAVRYDRLFETFGGQASIRPFVISTLPDACRIGSTVRRAGNADIARLAFASRRAGEQPKLIQNRGWQAGAWTIVEVEFHDKDNTWLTEVVFAIGDEIRLRVENARVVDWISADGDNVPDLVLRTARYNRDGYVLVYGAFSKQVAFSWSYH